MALKTTNTIILEIQDYVYLMGLPKDREKDETTINKIELFIAQATNQIDSLVSGNNDIGVLFRWWDNLQDNDIDNQKGLKLQRAIASWVETFLQNGKFFTDGVPIINANFNVDISSSSTNSNIEIKRIDIIQDLVAIGLYKTSNISFSNSNEINQEELNDFILVSHKYLNDNFIRRTPQFPLTGPIDMSSLKIENSGGINGRYQNANRPIIQSFKFLDCDFGKIDYSLNADKILDPFTNIYKAISQYDVNYFGGLTKEEIYTAIAASGLVWNATFTYVKGYITQFFNEEEQLLEWAESLVDNNIGNDPSIVGSTFWRILPTTPIDVSLIVEQLKPYIDTEITRQINELPTINVYSKEDTDTLIKYQASLIKENTFSLKNTFISGINMNASNINNVKSPIFSGDAVNKDYVDNQIFSTTINTWLNSSFFGGDFPIGYKCSDLITLMDDYGAQMIPLTYGAWNYFRLFDTTTLKNANEALNPKWRMIAKFQKKTTTQRIETIEEQLKDKNLDLSNESRIRLQKGKEELLQLLEQERLEEEQRLKEMEITNEEN